MASAIVLALSACGGDSDADSPATLTLGADSADVAWNAPTDVDVLANDKASRGTLSLSALSAPAHGTAAIADGKVRYTPASGYFGADELTYTVTGADAVTSTAKLSFSVAASLALSGTVTDGPIANAVISAAVGSKTVAATADANGAYSVTIRTADPADMVVITATGVGTQGKVKLVSAVGDAAALVARAGTTGKLAAAQLPALDVTHWSSSLLALVTDANGAKAPATQAQFESLLATISLQRALDMAAAIKLVVDHGVALPAGAADTLALIDKPSSSTLLSAFYLAQSAGDAPTPMDTARLEVLDGLAAAGSVSVAATAPQTLVYFVGDRLRGASAIDIAYKPDGTARVVTVGGARDATWKATNGVIEVTLAAPFSYDEVTADINPLWNRQDTLRLDTTGYRFAQVAGSSTSGAVRATLIGTTTIVGGPSDGTVVPFDTDSGFLLKVRDITAVPAADLAFAASDFAAGSVWAGVMRESGNFMPQDLLAVVDATKAKYVHANAVVDWSIVDGALVLVEGDTQTRYRRLIPEAATGEQHWLLQTYVGGVLTQVNERMAAKATPGLAFTADPINYRRWKSAVDDTFIVAVYAGGAAATLSVTLDGDSEPFPASWAIGSDGQLTQTRLSGSSRRVWQLLRRQAGSIIVMERLVAGSPDDTQGWRLNIYADGGPATPAP